MALKTGTQAPDFELHGTGGAVALSHLKDKPVVLFFYPRDFTRVCTKEACSFRDHFDEFRDINITVLGISTDSLEKHLQFKRQHNLPFELLSDSQGVVSKLYDAKMPFINMSKRVTYLLDKDHIIQGVYKELFEAENHVKNMLAKA